MFCGLCRITNTLKPSNDSKIWNCEANIRCRTKTVKEHFKSEKGELMMHTDAIATERAKRGTYFVEKEKEEETLSRTCNEKVLTSLYWLCKQEVAHSKLNSLLELESLGVDEVAQFSKRSSTVLRELLLIIGNHLKEDLLEKNLKSLLFWYTYGRGY